MDKKIAMELIKTRKNVKAKLDALKSSRMHNELMLQSSFKPLENIITKSFETHIKKEPKFEPKLQADDSMNQYKKNNLNETITDTPYHLMQKTPSKKTQLFNRSQINKSMFIPNDDESFSNSPENDTVVYTNANDQYFFDEQGNEPPNMNQTVLDNVNNDSFALYLDQYDVLPRHYVLGHIRDTNNEYDHHYLKHDLYTDKIHFGDSELNFEGPNLIIKNQNFPGTPGLYELIFKNEPINDNFTQQDYEQFGKILLLTNAHKRHFKPDEQIAGNRSNKYRFVIKPILKVIETENQANQEKHSKTLGFSQKSGYGLLKEYNKKPIELVYFNSFNELIDRLRLLIASKSAGNSSHTNEIISIIEELVESKIILK